MYNNAGEYFMNIFLGIGKTKIVYISIYSRFISNMLFLILSNLKTNMFLICKKNYFRVFMLINSAKTRLKNSLQNEIYWNDRNKNI